MAKIEKVELNWEAVLALLRADQTKGLCEELAQGIAQRASDGVHIYKTSSKTGSVRVSAKVYTDDWRTFGHNQKENDILKALR